MAESVITKEFEAIKTCLEVLEPLQKNQREFAVKMILARLDMDDVRGDQGGEGERRSSEKKGAEAKVGKGVGDGESAKDFLKRKRPQTELERVVCIAYYLTHEQDTPEFKTRDITRVNDTEAHQPKLSNAAATANNAVRQSKFFSQAAGGKKRITTVGEALVEALPDRESAAEAIKHARPSKKKVTKKKRARS